jgi:hypothetical protein
MTVANMLDSSGWLKVLQIDLPGNDPPGCVIHSQLVPPQESSQLTDIE